jgi:beta-glucosidase
MWDRASPFPQEALLASPLPRRLAEGSLQAAKMRDSGGDLTRPSRVAALLTFRSLRMPGFKFPKSFVFGAATAAYQVEGAYREDGRGESVWDRFSHVPGNIRNNDTGDVACDSYHRVDEDIACMKETGLDAYRFSIAWTRIVPDGDGAVNPKGLDWYSRFVDKLRSAGIAPYVTLFHWDTPQALEDKYGGWRSRKTGEAFARYAEIVVKHLGDRVKNWMPINEMPAVVVAGYGWGRHAPGVKLDRAGLCQVQHHVLLAHGYGVRAVREHGRAGSQVGTAHNPRCYVPAYDHPACIEAAGKAFAHYNGPMLEPMSRGTYPAKWLAGLGADAPRIEPGDMEIISAPCDFIGTNIYSGTFVRPLEDAPGAVPIPPTNTGIPSLAIDPVREDGFLEIPMPAAYPQISKIPLVPESLYWGVRHAVEIYGYKKVYITENGCPADDKMEGGEVLDTDRALYYRQYLQSAAQAVAEKLPLKGYFIWSLLDNFEWGMGYSARCGFYYVDYATQKRSAKLSAKYYASCIAQRRVL